MRGQSGNTLSGRGCGSASFSLTTSKLAIIFTLFSDGACAPMPNIWVFNGAESATLVGPHGHTAALPWALGGSVVAPESASQPGARRGSPRRPG